MNYERSELKTKWGIIGPGKIAHKFVQGMQVVEGAELYAVASRSQERATKFQKEYGATRAYDSYEKLVTDPLVDVVYVATTNNLHFEHAKLCLEHKKACLVEKPFTLTVNQLEELIDIATRNNVFLMEALWTRFLPSIIKVEEEIKKGSIGEITEIKADFGFAVPYNENSRLYSPQLGGGSLLDIGLYPVFFALHFLGTPENIESTVIRSKLGVDIEESIIFSYKNNVKANLQSSFNQDLACEAEIIGTKGSIKFERMWHCPTLIKLKKKSMVTDITPSYIGNGYNYEIEEVQDCLRSNLKQSNLFSLNSSISLLKTLELITQKWI